MKKIFVPLFIMELFSVSCETSSEVSNAVGQKAGPVTETQAGHGVREALSNGIASAIMNLNKANGFFGNQAYKMFLPADAKKMESTLRNIGLGSQVDKAILQVNRAAEDAVGYAKPIFVNAIKEMTIQDALALVQGSPSAATDYFRQKTRTQLIAAFSPSIKSSLDKVEATKYYSDLVNTYNKIPTTMKKINPDLPSYVAEKATDALFDQIQQEEANIRANPAARTSEILKKVFGM